ncbi:hypothetical protein [Nocardioides sp.]|uniref:hypothetical protein n=1 Tax=Nocardioides sp. TaxID=35761 RepID=UPI0025EF3F64|nr:hypothetical protein [Nocardioides sp.]
MSDSDIPDLSALGVPGAAQGAGALALYWTIGPSIQAVGRVFGEWTEYRLRNLLRIGEKVAKRIPSDPEPDGQGINPRAAKVLIEEASWVDDDLHQEYLAGLFVASRSPDGVSDDGAYYTRIVAGLSASQVRLHYGIYRAYYGSTLDGTGLDHRFNGSNDDLRAIAVWAPRQSYFDLAAAREGAASGDGFAAAVHGLQREGLVTEVAPPVVDDPHIVAVPSLLGAVVYHRAMGYTPTGVDAIRSDRAQLQRINPEYTFAELSPEPAQLAHARIAPVRV